MKNNATNVRRNHIKTFAISLGFWALASTSLFASTRQEVLDIGTHGAKIETDFPWKRQVLDRGMGKDQFSCRWFLKQFYATVIEQETISSERVDTERAGLMIGASDRRV